MDNQSCRKLIRLYGTKELLWNRKSSSYHYKSLREDAWREISNEMGVPMPELKKKMTVLLSSYRREKWRISRRQMKGSGRNRIYVSKWFGYEDFNFMQDKCTPNLKIDTMQDNGNNTSNDTKGATQLLKNDATPPINGSNERETMPPKLPQTKEKESSQTVHYTATKTNAKKRHMDHIISEADKKINDSFEILSNILQTNKREEDECDVYASLLAKKLRKYPERMRDRIMYKIDGLLLDNPYPDV